MDKDNDGSVKDDANRVADELGERLPINDKLALTLDDKAVDKLKEWRQKDGGNSRPKVK